jgi:high-affinity iron transporter
MSSRRLVAALAGPLFAIAAHAQDAALVVHLLDYIAADYDGAVAGGKVKDEGEYREMLEFAGNVVDALAKLAPTPERERLVSGAQALSKRIADKAEPEAVAQAAMRLRQAVVVAYRVPIGPKRAPDLARGLALFAQHCASCHGASGKGDGPAAKGMDPAPSDFHDRERQRLRSAHALFDTITRGVEGTSMRAFPQLAESVDMAREGKRELRGSSFLVSSSSFDRDLLRFEKSLLDEWLRREFDAPR